MSELHFVNLDLNLLRVFDALMEEGNVTRAGDRLGLSQSAVSHALARLRHALGDPLFSRKAGGIEPTPRAMEIGPALHAAMRQLEDALSPPVFNPATAERRFTLAAGPYASSILAPPLVELMRRTAPGVRLQLEAYSQDFRERLESGRLDAAVVSRFEESRGLKFVPLFVEDMVWVARLGHPLGEGPLTEARLSQVRRIAIAGYQGATAEEAKGLSALINQRAAQTDGRMVGITVPDTFTAVVIATRTDMIALAPRRLGQIAVNTGSAVMIEPLKPSEPLEVGIMFRADRLTIPAVAWFAKTLKAAALDI